MNFDFNILDELLLSKIPKHLGNVPLYGTGIKDMGDVMDWVLDLQHKKHLSEHPMFELQFLDKDPLCPEVIKDIAEHLYTFEPYKSRPSHVNTVGLVGLEGIVGFNWHHDVFHIVALNLIGNTTWHFKDHDSIPMKPGDLLFVPSPLKHSVTTDSDTSERFTVSFCCPTFKIIKKRYEVHTGQRANM